MTKSYIDDGLQNVINQEVQIVPSKYLYVFDDKKSGTVLGGVAVLLVAYWMTLTLFSSDEEAVPMIDSEEDSILDQAETIVQQLNEGETEPIFTEDDIETLKQLQSEIESKSESYEPGTNNSKRLRNALIGLGLSIAIVGIGVWVRSQKGEGISSDQEIPSAGLWYESSPSPMDQSDHSSSSGIFAFRENHFGDVEEVTQEEFNRGIMNTIQIQQLDGSLEIVPGSSFQAELAFVDQSRVEEIVDPTWKNDPSTWEADRQTLTMQQRLFKQNLGKNQIQSHPLEFSDAGEFDIFLKYRELQPHLFQPGQLWQNENNLLNHSTPLMPDGTLVEEDLKNSLVKPSFMKWFFRRN